MVLKSSIADWWFEDRTKVVSIINYEAFSELIEMCEKCISILKDYRLLIPTEIILDDRWIYFSENGEHEGVQKITKNIKFPIRNNDGFKKIMLDHVSCEQRKKGFLHPAIFSIIGNGHILDKSGVEIEEFNVIKIEALFTDAPVINVLTYSTAWLPYSLKGDSQVEIHKKNAPRLENALIEIEKALGCAVVEDDDEDDFSDYCLIKGYRLENFKDDDGEVLPIGEDGHPL